MMNRRCPSCQTVAREGAVYCPQCGTSLAKVSPPVPFGSGRPKSRKFSFGWLFVGLICFGVFSRHHGRNEPPSAIVADTPSPTAIQSLPADVLQAIQPSSEVEWSPGGELSLKIYNGSDWIVHSIDLEVQIDQGRHIVRQTYRSIATKPLAPMESDYFTVRTALARTRDNAPVTVRVMGAIGSRTN